MNGARNVTATFGVGGALPAAPTGVTATAGNGSISVSFTPSAIGGGTLVTHLAYCTKDGNATWSSGTNTVSPIVVSNGIVNGNLYYCDVITQSTLGWGIWSDSSNPAVPGTLPDLVVTNVTAPATAIPGTVVTGSATVLNQGAGSAADSWVVFYLSTDATITTSDVSTNWGCHVALAPGETFTCNDIHIPANLPWSTYYIGAIADAFGVVTEFNETNNGRAASSSTAVTMLPVCTLSANPVSIHKGHSSTLTASCSPTTTSYRWTGGTCAGKTVSTCTVSPGVTTTYGVTGTNSYGSSTSSAMVTVKAVDLTPILMLLLD
jgi:hypothetical protein